MKSLVLHKPILSRLRQSGYVRQASVHIPHSCCCYNCSSSFCCWERGNALLSILGFSTMNTYIWILFDLTSNFPVQTKQMRPNICSKWTCLFFMNIHIFYWALIAVIYQINHFFIELTRIRFCLVFLKRHVILSSILNT